MDSDLLRSKRVLVIEDEMLVLMGIEDMLSDLGCTAITVATTVKNALASIAANTFDFAMLDVNLDSTPSYAVADALKCHHIPFAFSTGYGKHGVQEGYGDRPVLNKPYSPCQLKKVIRELMTDGAPPPIAA